MIQRNYVRNQHDITENWKDRVVWIWVEDDVNYVDKEFGAAAFKRITGTSLSSSTPVLTVDEGDVFYKFFRGGWVLQVSYEGSEVGILTKEEK